MGGNAFGGVLPHSAFPRLPPNVYRALKARITPLVQSLYTHVATPIEAPEKLDHGDLDFTVAGPRELESGVEDPSQAATKDVAKVNVPHERVKSIIGATYCNGMEGNRTSNFAIPVPEGEWAHLGHAEEEQQRRCEVGGSGQIYYQVDIHVCTDKPEFDRIVFFNSYGDLGMIMGLIARNVGLHLSHKGLKLPNPPHRPITLSDSFDDIVAFFGCSMEKRAEGFKTKQEVFEWAGGSRFFNPRRFKSEGPGAKKVKPDRKMYAEFAAWAKQQVAVTAEEGTSEDATTSVQQEALAYFRKEEEFYASNRAVDTRVRLKSVFNGTNVRMWTGLGEYWKGVKMVMDRVRKQLDGDEGVLRVFDEEGEEGVKRVVMRAMEELGLVSAEVFDVQQRVGGLVLKDR